jgi:hypothetical protein
MNINEKTNSGLMQLMKKMVVSAPVDPAKYGIKLESKGKPSSDHALSPYKPASTLVEQRKPAQTKPASKPVQLKESNIYDVPDKVFAFVEYGTAKKQLGEKEGRVLRMIQEGNMLHITLELKD